jgi:hypothetical protein
LLECARDLKVLPHWLVRRLTEDTRLCKAGLLAYAWEGKRLAKIAALSFVDKRLTFTKSDLAAVRKLILKRITDADTERPIADPPTRFSLVCARGAPRWFAVQLCEQGGDMFVRKFLALVNPAG